MKLVVMASLILFIHGILLPLVTVFADDQPLAQWSFDNTLNGVSNNQPLPPRCGSGNLVPGRSGQALQPATNGIVYPFPAPLISQGALCFWYQASAVDPKEITEILRMGDTALIVHLNRVLWKTQGDLTEQLNLHAFYPIPPLDKWVLIECDWGRTTRSPSGNETTPLSPRIFINGRLASIANKPKLMTFSNAELTLLTGAFDEVLMFSNPMSAGTRFQGVIFSEQFDGKALPGNWYVSGNNKRLEPEHVTGAVGSAGAISSKEPLQRHFSMGIPNISFVVTEDTWVCLLVNSTEDVNVAFCIPTPQNHHFQVPVIKNKWTPLRFSMSDFQLKTGEMAVQFSIQNPGRTLIRYSIDNFAVIRGKKTSRPTAPASIEAKLIEGGVQISWEPATDEAGVAAYRVFRSNVAADQVDPNDEIVRTTDMTIVDTSFPNNYGTWWYQVVAEDHLGNLGAATAPMAVNMDSK